MKLPKKEFCSGCGACATICTKLAITMQYDHEGFIYPVIDHCKCIKCGLCEKRCPVNSTKDISHPYLNIYAGFSRDKEVMSKTASGGFATELSYMIVDKGGIVAGVKYDKNFVKSIYGIATNRLELNAFCSSKYVQSEKREIYQKIKQKLNEGINVLFVGCPCDVAGLYAVLGKDCIDNLLTCELVCMGVTSYRIGADFKNYVEKKYNDTICGINSRSKGKGWFVPHLAIDFKKRGLKFQALYASYYGRGFQIYNRPSCFTCKYRGTTGWADLRIGDFWGIKKSDEFWNEDGVSCIFVRTPKGQKAIDNLRLRNYALFDVSYEYATENNMSSVINKPQKYIDLRTQFAEIYLEKGLIEACDKTADWSYRIKKIIPLYFHPILKRLFHIIRDKKIKK